MPLETSTEESSSDELSGWLPRLNGTFHVASRVRRDAKEELFPLGILRVFPSEPDGPPGQWVFWLDEALQDGRSTLIELAARLGLVPLHFSDDFENILKKPGPICLVADTNTLYHGSLFQALEARRHKATHVAIADQVLMELQKQREVAYTRPSRESRAAPKQEPTENGNSSERLWVKTARRATQTAAGGRTLRKIRDLGHIVHVARPPDAMVRYFGGSRHAGEDAALESSDEGADLVGSNTLRDRLILEAVLRQRVVVPGVPVFLLTDDALLAAQASIEGVNVGFSWLPSKIEPAILTSPFISPRSLEIKHVPLEDFLDELLWTAGNVVLRREGERRAITARLPAKKRDRVLCELNDRGHQVTWSEERSDPWSRVRTVAQKSPSPEALVAALLGGLNAPVPDGPREVDRYCRQYLGVLGWIDEGGQLTARGRDLATTWLRLDYDDVDAWASWIEGASPDLRKLEPIATVVATLEDAGTADDTTLGKNLGISTGTVAAQMGLASAFGLVVRLGSKGRAAASWDNAPAKAAIVRAIQQMLNEATGTTAVNIGRLFTSLQRPELPAMAFHVFRRALLNLENEGRVVFSGSVPSSSSDVKIQVLMTSSDDRQVKWSRVAIGSGAHIVAGRSAKVVQLVEGAST